MRSKGEKYLAEQFRKYQNGQIDEQRKQIIEDWFDEQYTAKNTSSPTINKAALAEELFSNIQQTVTTSRSVTANVWLKIASVFLLFGIAGLLWRASKKEDKVFQEAAYIRYSTANLEMKKVMLTDGSVIWLNAATAIRVPVTFSHGSKREIILDHGEAFFEVKRDTTRPFQIHSGKYLTTVLGTSFNIRNYPGEHQYSLAVRTGKVKVERKVKNGYALLSAGLTRNKLLKASENSQSPIIRTIDTRFYHAWMAGGPAYLEDADLIQIGAALERQYNLKVKVETNGKALARYSLLINRENIKQVLQMLAVKTGINYQLTGRKLIIKTGK